MTDQELKEALAAAGIEKCAQWYCEFNSYRWPEGFPEPKPEGWDGMEPQGKRLSVSGNRAFHELRMAVPEKERLWAWNEGGYAGRRLTREEFEKWYAWTFIIGTKE